jgi:hypothetical protein
VEEKMLRKLVGIAAAVVAIGCVAIGSTNALSSIADFGGIMAYATKADFDQAFAAASSQSRPENTPANREKLRVIGWKLISQSQPQ